MVNCFVDSNFAAVGASTFREINRVLADHFVSLLILNTDLCGHSGVEFARQLQRNGNHVPVIFITDRHSQIDRISALEVGDDLVQKPIIVKELVARARAVLRRSATSRDWHITENVTLNDEPFMFCGAKIYPKDLRISFPNGNDIYVGRKEIGLMAAFASTDGAILSRRDIIHRVWGLHADIRSRSLDQYVVRIRYLFRRNGCPSIDLLRTIHGVGYLCMHCSHHANPSEDDGKKEEDKKEGEETVVEKEEEGQKVEEASQPEGDGDEKPKSTDGEQRAQVSDAKLLAGDDSQKPTEIMRLLRWSLGCINRGAARPDSAAGGLVGTCGV
jgi:two-component system alkaline phosphatase synthesis response regulator PhoP